MGTQDGVPSTILPHQRPCIYNYWACAVASHVWSPCSSCSAPHLLSQLPLLFRRKATIKPPPAPSPPENISRAHKSRLSPRGSLPRSDPISGFRAARPHFAAPHRTAFTQSSPPAGLWEIAVGTHARVSASSSPPREPRAPIVPLRAVWDRSLPLLPACLVSFYLREKFVFSFYLSSGIWSGNLVRFRSASIFFPFLGDFLGILHRCQSNLFFSFHPWGVNRALVE